MAHLVSRSPDLRWALNLHVDGSPSIFFFHRAGPTAPRRSPYESYWGPTWVTRATFGHPPAEGPQTYARERDPGRGSATGSRKVAPPAGPSHLTPSRPGEAKPRSREAPRSPCENENPNQKTTACPWWPAEESKSQKLLFGAWDGRRCPRDTKRNPGAGYSTLWGRWVLYRPISKRTPPSAY